MFPDRTSGQCKCAPQYGSSNGDGRNGSLGDCGFLNAMWQYPFPLPDPVVEYGLPYD